MVEQSAGILLYRYVNSHIEVFLVHPGGPYSTKKDLGIWSIPKGKIELEETPFIAAKREFTEETSFSIQGDFREMIPIRQSGQKIVYAWSIEGDCDAEMSKSNLFTMEWPPHSGSFESFPEIDQAAWFDLKTAYKKIIKGQQNFIDQLVKNLQSPEENSVRKV